MQPGGARAGLLERRQRGNAGLHPQDLEPDRRRHRRFGSSVRITGINRELDQYLQRQIRTETPGAYADLRAELSRPSAVGLRQAGFGRHLEDAFNKLTTAVQALSTSPDSQSARIGVVNAAQALAQQLNATTQGIQSLRANAEAGLTVRSTSPTTR